MNKISRPTFHLLSLKIFGKSGVTKNTFNNTITVDTNPYPNVIFKASIFSKRYKLKGRKTNRKAKTKPPENKADFIWRAVFS
jgi:hypothetical protein